MGVFVWAPAPFFGFCCVFCCLLRCFRWRNASLAGGFAGRRFLFGCGFRFCCFNRFADSKDPLSLYSVFSAYSHVRTEPLARHRPHSRKKKTGRATREALLSEAGFEKLFRTQNWVRRSKLFCRCFCFLLRQAGCKSVAAWTQLKDVEGSFLWFRFVWWLDCLLLKESASAFCSLRWLLEVFLAIAEFVGFRAGGRLPFDWLYWILYCPLLAPLAPLDSYQSFQPRKNMNVFFSQSRY